MTKIDEAIRKLRTAARGSKPEAPSYTSAARDNASALLREHDTPLVPRTTRAANLEAESLTQLGYSVPAQDRALLTDQYRVIKRPLLGQAFGRNADRTDCGNFVQVTSSLPGEGKTFTCLNLALSIAQEQDQAVILVDADVLNPRLSQAVGLADSPGFLDYLENPALEAEAVAYGSNVAGLVVIPAGNPRHNGAELLSGARMNAFVSEVVRQRPNHMVLLDSPPIAPTSEARIIAESAGQIVVVVSAGQTAQDTVREAVQALPPEKPVSLILNRVRHRTIHGTYGYGYGNNKPATAPPVQVVQSAE